MRTVLISFIVFIVFGVGSPVAAEDSLGQLAGLEKVGEAIPDTDLGTMRGKGFGGLAVRVLFEGFVDHQGGVTSNLEVEEGNPGGSPSVSSELGNGDVKLLAQIGEFNDANGVFQVTQVPGSNNNVTNNLYIQIAIINVLNGAEPAAVSIPGVTGGLFGAP